MKQGRFRTLFKLSWQLMKLRLAGGPRAQQETNRLLFQTFENLGGVYVKFLQILILDQDFLRGWAGPAEYDVFENVEYEDIDLAELLKAEMPDYERHFLSIDLRPLAAGALAQV
jgi:predicted unusual protein kinase regulating ubiquinone biosynthesis (AarF/ABC1/UbiB family)